MKHTYFLPIRIEFFFYNFIFLTMKLFNNRSSVVKQFHCKKMQNFSVKEFRCKKMYTLRGRYPLVTLLCYRK